MNYNDENLAEAISGFEEELTCFNIEPLGHAIITEAENLLEIMAK